MTPSLVWGERQGGGDPFETHSPLDGALLAEGELLGVFDALGRSDLPRGLDLVSGTDRLAAELRRLDRALVDAARRETGFSLQDSEELIEGSIAYVEAYASHPSTALVSRTEEIRSDRRMRLVDVPVGTVAAILPHNAFLPLALSVGLNALHAGNRAILRAPQGSALSASLLTDALERTPELAPWLSVAVCSARPFVDWFLKAPLPGLLHFFGSSRHAADLVARGFTAGKDVLIDGEGNAWAYVDAGADPEAAARILAEGAFRYRGQTCTSLNGAFVHPSLFAEVSQRVVAHAREAESGPLFDEAQAEWCLSRVLGAGGEIVAGGARTGSVLEPTVLLNPDPRSELVREGLFGPALWLASGDESAFAAHWPSNRFPLCAAVLQEPADPEGWAARLPNVARLVLNGDPSVEDPFEFWGGYPPSGQNPVSPWPAKYRRTIQVDTPLDLP